MITIAVANQKGGSGKTTTAVNVSAGLMFRGYRTLLVDLDPQAQASTSLRIERPPESGTVFDLLLESRRPQAALREVGVPVYKNLTLLPSETLGPDDELRLLAQANPCSRLRTHLSGAADDYDFALIDCPPTLGVLTRSALAAADAVLLTVESSFLAVHGLGKLLELVRDIRRERDLQVMVVATMVDGRTRFARSVVNDMRGFFHDMMCTTVIRRSVRLAECASYGMPIFTYDMNSNGAEDYDRLSRELLARFALPTKGPHGTML